MLQAVLSHRKIVRKPETAIGSWKLYITSTAGINTQEADWIKEGRESRIIGEQQAGQSMQSKQDYCIQPITVATTQSREKVRLIETFMTVPTFSKSDEEMNQRRSNTSYHNTNTLSSILDRGLPDTSS